MSTILGAKIVFFFFLIRLRPLKVMSRSASSRALHYMHYMMVMSIHEDRLVQGIRVSYRIKKGVDGWQITRQQFARSSA